ncbi:MAG TPA: MoaD/ThiS family protein [Nevskiaceae bacterium]|nr:MoaD/ThiS family protein [Nevskiaceae bacterium]
MKLAVTLWGVARRLAGTSALSVELVDGATVADLASQLAAHGELSRELPRCAFAVGDDLVPRTHRLAEGDEVAVLPPVSGG